MTQGAKTIFLCSVLKYWSRGTRPEHVGVFSFVYQYLGVLAFVQFAFIKRAQELMAMSRPLLLFLYKTNKEMIGPKRPKLPGELRIKYSTPTSVVFSHSTPGFVKLGKKGAHFCLTIGKRTAVLLVSLPRRSGKDGQGWRQVYGPSCKVSVDVIVRTIFVQWQKKPKKVIEKKC